MADESLRPLKAGFLEALRVCGVITKAAEIAGCSRQSHYDWLKADETGEYAKAFHDAMEASVDLMESEARRRAIEGIEETVFDKQGRETGHRIKYSDVLLIFMLKGARPDKYRDTIMFEPSKLTEQELDAKIASLRAETDRTGAPQRKKA